MVAAAFPAAKLGALLVKQISKPIAKFAQEKAKTSPVFRKYVCIPPAQFYHWCEVKMRMWILNLGKPTTVPELNERMAIELGASLLGEAVIFIIASGILVAEYTRSSRKESRKEAELLEERTRQKQIMEELYFLTQRQETEIKQLTRMIYDLEGRVVQKPWKLKKDKDLSSEPPPPPPLGPSSIPVKAPITVEEIELESSKITHINESSGIPLTSNNDLKNQPNTILRAVASIQSDFFASKQAERKDGLLMNAINHIYKDVYRLPLRM